MQQSGSGLDASQREQGVANFNDLLADAIAFPAQAKSEEEAQRVGEHVQRYFEETWIHRPLKSLNGISPIDAAGHGVLRKKLRGVVQFVQDVAANPAAAYDFNRLRHKLGLAEKVAAPVAESRDRHWRMNAAELAGLPRTTFRTISRASLSGRAKLDARELTGQFAKTLVTRPRTERPLDRYPWYAHLVQLAQGEGDLDRALNYVTEGERGR